MKMNHHYGELKASYLFVDIAHKVAAYQEAHPEKEIIRLGIGDVTQPLAKCVVTAMQDAAAEMGTKEGFHGYGPEQGYPFLKQAIQGYYAGRGTQLAEDEIFISDGAKSDLANVLGLFDVDNTVLVPDPVYPTYVDDNVTDGRKIIYGRTSQENGFLGMPDDSVKADIIYICSPNNPTGAAYTREQLKAWVDYINAHGTGTPNNDASESAAMLRLFGDRVPPVSSTKAFTGHTTSASGAIETVICLLALRHGFLPVNLNWQHPMDNGIVPVRESRPPREIRHVLCNSFGFGGNDSSLLLSKWQER